MVKEAHKIQLQFDKKINNLAGNRYGREIYQEQLKDKIRETERYEIELPEIIEDVASSFIQGIYSELAEKVGKEKAMSILELHSQRKEVDEKIRTVLRTYNV